LDERKLELESRKFDKEVEFRERELESAEKELEIRENESEKPAWRDPALIRQALGHRFNHFHHAVRRTEQ
jgi:hypothetical protein